MSDGRYEYLYEQTIQGEQETKELLIQFEREYPGITKAGNANNIAEKLQKKSDKSSIIAQLRQKKSGTENAEQEKKD